MRALRIIFVGLLFVVVLLTAAQPDFAQCAMCRASLAGSNNAAFIRNLNLGVLVLLVPPVAIFCSIFVVLKRRKGEETGDGE